MPGRVASTSNPLVKHARKLRQRKHRDSEGAFLVEGIAPVLTALELGAGVDVVMYQPESLDSPTALERLRNLPEGVRLVELTPQAFGALSERDHPVGLAAIVRTGRARLRDLEVAPDSLFVALHEVGNPGNVGTVVRSLDAVDGSGLIVSGASTDPWHPTSVKASMGALFSVPVCVTADVLETITWARDHDMQVVTTSAHGDVEHYRAPWRTPALIVFGSEGGGLSRDLLDRGDLSVRIPMRGGATSLNLAVSVGVLLYEARRPR